MAMGSVPAPHSQTQGNLHACIIEHQPLSCKYSGLIHQRLIWGTGSGQMSAIPLPGLGQEGARAVWALHYCEVYALCLAG